jgi:hypothetical protein
MKATTKKYFWNGFIITLSMFEMLSVYVQIIQNFSSVMERHGRMWTILSYWLIDC